MGKKIGMKCPRCGAQFQLGHNGSNHNGVSMCDKCSGEKRDANDWVWRAWETHKEIPDYEAGEYRIVMRPAGL
jgi:hypothetical protein